MASNVVRVSLMGSLPGGEEWSINPVFATGSSEEISYDDCAAMVTAINAISVPGGILSNLNTSTFVTGCRVEARQWDGTLEAQSENARTPVSGSAGSVTHPFQSAIVLSLRTGRPGPSGRGRLYLPATGTALTSSTLRVSSAAVTTTLAGAKTWLSDIQAALETVLGSPTPLSVWSRTGLFTSEVNRILVGDILDVQRRRRDVVPEAYSAVAY